MTNSHFHVQCGKLKDGKCPGVKKVRPGFKKICCRKCEENVGHPVKQGDKLFNEVERVSVYMSR